MFGVLLLGCLPVGYVSTAVALVGDVCFGLGFAW